MAEPAVSTNKFVQYADIGLAGLLVFIVVMMIIPIPTMLLDQ